MTFKLKVTINCPGFLYNLLRFLFPIFHGIIISVLCLDCQRHEIYKTQYRAMFVVNCSVNTSQKMSFPLKNKKGKTKKTVSDESYHPVTCDTCKTEVAMYDRDEIYHFFNIVSSHS